MPEDMIKEIETAWGKTFRVCNDSINLFPRLLGRITPMTYSYLARYFFCQKGLKPVALSLKNTYSYAVFNMCYLEGGKLRPELSAEADISVWVSSLGPTDDPVDFFKRSTTGHNVTSGGSLRLIKTRIDYFV